MILFYIFILSLPFVEHPIFGMGFEGVTIEKMIGAAVIAYATVHLVRRKAKPLFIDTWPNRAFLAFFLLCLCSYLFLGRQPAAGGHVLGFQPFNFLTMMFMTVAVVDSIPRLRWTLLYAIASVAWSSLYMLREWLSGIRTYGYSYRPGYVVGDPNYFAASALLCLPLACYFARTMPERWIRWCCGTSVVLILAGLTVSASRGGFLGLAVVVLLMITNSKQRVRGFVVTAAVGVLFLVLSPTSPLQRILHPTASDDTAKEIRLELWDAAWRIFKDNPAFGVGYGNWRSVAPAYVAGSTDGAYVHLPHNQYLEVMAEMGLLGVLLFICMFVASIAALHQVRRMAKRAGSSFLFHSALGIQIGLFGYAVAVFFISAMFLRLFWFMVFVSGCLQALTRSALKAQLLSSGILSQRRSHRRRDSEVLVASR